VESGVNRIEVHASLSTGGYAWAAQGFDWGPGSRYAAERIMANVRSGLAAINEDLAELRHGVAPERLAALQDRYGGDGTARDLHERMWREKEGALDLLDRARVGFDERNDPNPGYPTPFEISQAGRSDHGGRDVRWIGKQALLGEQWHGVMRIGDGPVANPHPRHPEAGFTGRPVTAARVPDSDFHGRSRETSDPAAVRAAADEALGGRPFDIGGRRVDVDVVPAGRLPDDAVARSVPVDGQGRDLPDGHLPPPDGGYRIEISDRASDLAVPRALAHERAELAAIQERAAAGLDAATPDVLRPGPLPDGAVPGARDLSPHDRGRLAEREFLHRLAEDPQHAAYAARELAALDRHLGLHPDDHGASARLRAAEELRAVEDPVGAGAAPRWDRADVDADGRLTSAAVQRELAARVAPHSPDLADVVARLYQDHDNHPLSLTQRLGDPASHPRMMELLRELAAGEALGPYRGVLAAFLAEHPGSGRLFEPVADVVNLDDAGISRKQAFVDEAKQADPARDVGPAPTAEQVPLLAEYARRLSEDVLPAVEAEMTALANEVAATLGTEAYFSARAKNAAEILNKIGRMVAGNENMAPRPHYRSGDVIDAVGARITVSDMRTLAAVFDEVTRRLGVGDGGRILEIENMYAQPKSRAPEYRVIPMIIKIEVDGAPYTFELQLTTERASAGADINHNTIYKPYVGVDEGQLAAIERAMREAAALDQLETREQR
jgi:ppGpp synthetase/RelA/SpoT-type nucleotidyltranferase